VQKNERSSAFLLQKIAFPRHISKLEYHKERKLGFAMLMRTVVGELCCVIAITIMLLSFHCFTRR